MAELPPNCLDCDTPLSGAAYCLNCGQKAGPARITLRKLLGALLGETFELDGRVPRTLVPLFVRPGKLTAEYTAGRRTRYTAPLRLLLGAGAVWVVLGFGIAQWRAVRGASPSENLTIQVDDPSNPGELVQTIGLGGTAVGEALDERLQTFNGLPNGERNKRVRNAASEVPPLVAFLLLPLVAVFLKILFFRSGRTVPEHAIFALHLHAFGLFVTTFVRLIGDDRAIGFGALWFVGYLLLALRRAYALSWWAALWRWFVLGLFYMTVSTTLFGIAVLSKAIAD